MTRILVLAGKKQSGKSSAANFVVGYTLSQLGRSGVPFLPTNFTIDEEDGSLIINTAVSDADDNVVIGNGVLDLNRKDDNFFNWSVNCMWPYIKTYAFAERLKELATTIFNIPEELVYGSDEDKRKKTHITWKSMCRFLPPRKVSEIKKAGKQGERMSVREFLQYFGTNVCRLLYDDCWTNACFKDIAIDGALMAVIQDCRFRNEIQAAKKANAKIVKLERAPFDDDHNSENDLDSLNKTNYDLIVPPEVTIREKNQMILEAMYSWGWFSEHIDLETIN